MLPKTFKEINPTCCYECCNCTHLDNGYYYCEKYKEYLTDEDYYVIEHVCDDFN